MPPVEKGRYLYGYKEIAAFIEERLGVKVSAAECCKYAHWRVHPLPVLNTGTGRRIGTATADPLDVELWARRWFKVLRH